MLNRREGEGIAAMSDKMTYGSILRLMALIMITFTYDGGDFYQ